MFILRHHLRPVIPVCIGMAVILSVAPKTIYATAQGKLQDIPQHTGPYIQLAVEEPEPILVFISMYKHTILDKCRFHNGIRIRLIERREADRDLFLPIFHIQIRLKTVIRIQSRISSLHLHRIYHLFHGTQFGQCRRIIYQVTI